MARPRRRQELNGRNLLSRDQLRQVAEDDAQRLLGMSADDAWQLIEQGDPKVAGTIAETELKNLHWLLQND